MRERPTRKPSPEHALIARSGLFDVNHYLIEAPDVASDGCDPLVHFCRFGAAEGRRPNLYFDPAWYADLYLRGQTETWNPLCHYIRVGEPAGFRPICYFEPTWYARTYALPKGTSALAHYLRHRRSQAYAPNALFDLDFYLGRYGGEIGPNRDAFAHFLRCGGARDLDPSANFSSQAYRERHGLDAALRPARLADHEACIPLVHHLDRTAHEEARRV